jgi:AcrR family transcriptional regulator
VNDCLQHPSPERQPTRGPLPDEAAIFERMFADAPDLAHLTWAARRMLAAAAALFYRQGAAATSIRDITKACGLSPGALYKHFAGKDDVLDVLVVHGHAALERRIDAAMDGLANEPTVRTRAFVHAYVMGHLEHPELAQVIRREYLHLSEPRYEATVKRRRQLRERLSALLRAGQSAGTFELIDGRNGATRVAVMILDMCSRTSEWYNAARAEKPHELADRYVVAALRLAGARPTT